MIAAFLTRGHQGVESHLLRWQSKMDGDQVIAGTFLAGIAKVLEEEGLAPQYTGLATLQAGRRHRSQRATIHHDDGTGGFIPASQLLASYFSDPRSCKHLNEALLSSYPIMSDISLSRQQQHSVKSLSTRDGIEASCGCLIDCHTSLDQSYI